MEVLKIGIILVKFIRDFHKLGFIHGDITPNNITIDSKNQVIMRQDIDENLKRSNLR